MVSNRRSHDRTVVRCVKGLGYCVANPLKNAVGGDLLPQRPRHVRGQAEPSGHILEPGWKGIRVLVPVGSEGPRFVSYTGAVGGPPDPSHATVADTHCRSAV